MGTIKGKNNQDLMEEEQIKKRWQEYTELYKKGLNDPDNHEGVVTRLEPDILECRGGDGIPVELFQILKYDAVKVL